MSAEPKVSVLWRRLDGPGCEWAQAAVVGGALRLSGVAVFSERLEDRETPCRLDYVIMCGPDGRTRTAAISGSVGARLVRFAISAESDGRWSVNGAPAPALDGCDDLDLSFSPATNLLPLARLDLAVGASAEVRSAWLRFPELTLAPLLQRYERRGARTYAYESLSPVQVAAELEVSGSGLVLRDPGRWEAEAIEEP
jgi:hypothetical protein